MDLSSQLAEELALVGSQHLGLCYSNLRALAEKRAFYEDLSKELGLKEDNFAELKSLALDPRFVAERPQIAFNEIPVHCCLLLAVLGAEHTLEEILWSARDINSLYPVDIGISEALEIMGNAGVTLITKCLERASEELSVEQDSAVYGLMFALKAILERDKNARDIIRSTITRFLSSNTAEKCMASCIAAEIAVEYHFVEIFDRIEHLRDKGRFPRYFLNPDYRYVSACTGN